MPPISAIFSEDTPATPDSVNSSRIRRYIGSREIVASAILRRERSAIQKTLRPIVREREVPQRDTDPRQWSSVTAVTQPPWL